MDVPVETVADSAPMVAVVVDVPVADVRAVATVNVRKVADVRVVATANARKVANVLKAADVRVVATASARKVVPVPKAVQAPVHVAKAAVATALQPHSSVVKVEPAEIAAVHVHQVAAIEYRSLVTWRSPPQPGPRNRRR